VAGGSASDAAVAHLRDDIEYTGVADIPAAAFKD
jgi:hypothetical protein